MISLILKADARLTKTGDGPGNLCVKKWLLWLKVRRYSGTFKLTGLIYSRDL